jgi:hypothetical protein
MTKLILTIAVFVAIVSNSVQTSAAIKEIQLPNSLVQYSKYTKQFEIAKIVQAKEKNDEVGPADEVGMFREYCLGSHQIYITKYDSIYPERLNYKVCSDTIKIKAKRGVSTNADFDEIKTQKITHYNDYKYLATPSFVEDMHSRQDEFVFATNPNGGKITEEIETVSGKKYTNSVNYRFVPNPSCTGRIYSIPYGSYPSPDQIKEAYSGCNEKSIIDETINIYEQIKIKSELEKQESQLKYQKALRESGLNEDQFLNKYSYKRQFEKYDQSISLKMVRL